jgi:hypothetical protein
VFNAFFSSIILLHEETGVTILWLKKHVVPDILVFLNKKYNIFIDVLTFPYVGARINVETSVNLCSRICFQYELMPGLQEHLKLVQLMVYRVEKQLGIENAVSYNNNGKFNVDYNQILQTTNAQINGLVIKL